MLLPLPSNARSALVIVDMQEFFFRKPERREGLNQVVANINRLIEHFESRQFPVCHVITAFKPNGSDWELKMQAANEPELIEGTAETEILPQVRLRNTHRIFIKTRYSAFFKTPLAEHLQSENIQRVVVGGAYTHYCVNATIFDAYCHDFVPCIITDAVTSHLQDEAAMLIERMKRNGYHVLTTDQLIAQT
jgi:nicotinamidase-related amidase